MVSNRANRGSEEAMQFLKTAFWVILAMIITLFTFTNWTPVTINLWGGSRLDTWLPLVVIVAFAAGSLPLWLLHKATRWRMTRKLATAERALAATTPPPPPASVTPAPLPVAAKTDNEIL
jgi:lipopolysaccharide assembly protein A